LDPVAPIEAVESTYPEAAIPINDRQAQLDLLNQQVSGCTRCEILSSCRKKTVFGEGSVSPRVVFFGEGPGADEDRTGRPFVGRAGELLTRMIQACSFAREDVYILNTVKCRPPGNRNPEPDEIENCREYYQRQLAILRPQYIVCLGAVSSQELLKSKLPVGRLRGRFHAYFESKVVVTYHPAYLLRNESAKKAAWTDLQMMLRDAGIQVG
jgi:DNA polymerase